MSRKSWQRLWKTAFTTLVVSVFAGFCVFWSRAFADLPAAELDFAARSEAGCSCTLPPAPSEPATPSAVAAALAGDTAQDEGSDDAPPPEHLSADDRVRGLEAQAESRMFRARIYGPYALSVRDGLNEMLIGSHLIAQGVEAAADPSLSLEAVMSALPSQLPARGYITSGFGERRSPFTGRSVHHNGIDFAVTYGGPVEATADGVVVYAGWWHQLGRMVAIDHGYGIVTRYGHNSKLLVKVGDRVHRGQQIAKAGSTGRSTGSHVHYEVWVNDHAIDPSQFMFEVPAPAAVALDAYPGQSAVGSGLGLAMGGDDDGSGPFTRSPAAAPPAVERLPVNLAIVGGFGLLAAMLVGSLVPLSGRDEVPI